MKKTVKIIALLFVVILLVSCGNKIENKNENKQNMMPPLEDNKINMMPPLEDNKIDFYKFMTHDELADAILYSSEMNKQMFADAEEYNFTEQFTDTLNMFLNGELTLLVPKFEYFGEEVPYQKNDIRGGDVFLNVSRLFFLPGIRSYYLLNEKIPDSVFTVEIFYPKVLKNEKINNAENIRDVIRIIKGEDAEDFLESCFTSERTKNFKCYPKEFVIRNGTPTKAIVCEYLNEYSKVVRYYETKIYMYIENVIVEINIGSNSKYYNATDELVEGFYLEPYEPRESGEGAA